jgi:RNA polymerase sigma-70 factor (ECF subfamily)
MQSRASHITTSTRRERVASAGFRAGTQLQPVDREITNAIVRAQAGEADAIRVLYLRYKDNVYGYVLSIVRDQHEAEDVTQHVFLKLMSVIHKYRAQEVPFTSWLLRVARNVAVDHLRHRRLLPCEEVYAPTCASDESSHERRRELEHALEALPEDQRNVVVLRHLVGLSPGEIAERMGRSEASIHGLHHRGRHALKRELAATGCAPTARAA